MHVHTAQDSPRSTKSKRNVNMTRSQFHFFTHLLIFTSTAAFFVTEGFNFFVSLNMLELRLGEDFANVYNFCFFQFVYLPYLSEDE